MPYASQGDLEALLGRTLAGIDAIKAHTMLDIISTAIDGYLDGRTADEAVTRSVCQLATRRLFERPDGVSQEQLGDWLTSYVPTSLLNDDERAMLDQAGASGTRRRTYGSPRIPSGTWVTNSNDTDPIGSS